MLRPCRRLLFLKLHAGKFSGKIRRRFRECLHEFCRPVDGARTRVAIAPAKIGDFPNEPKPSNFVSENELGDDVVASLAGEPLADPGVVDFREGEVPLRPGR